MNEPLSSQPATQVREQGHVVVAGHNAHLMSLLRQLDRSRMYALEDGRGRGKQV
jgi:hypothetical protein